MSTLADRIKELRGKIPRNKFAEILGISEGSLVKYESGERVPNAGTIGSICTKLGVSSDWLLFGRAISEYAGKTGDMPLKSPQEILQPYRNIDSGEVEKGDTVATFDIDKQKALHSLGQRLRELRGTQTRSEFAYAYLVPTTSLARWEAGESQPDLGFLVRLVTSLGITLEWLVTGQGESSPKGRLEADKQLGFLDKIDWTEAQKQGQNAQAQKQPAPSRSTVPCEGCQTAQHDLRLLERELRMLEKDTRATEKELRHALREIADLRVQNERLRAELERCGVNADIICSRPLTREDVGYSTVEETAAPYGRGEAGSPPRRQVVLRDTPAAYGPHTHDGEDTAGRLAEGPGVVQEDGAKYGAKKK